MTALQLKLGGTETPVAPLAGAVSAGAAKAGPAVVKLKTFDHAAVPRAADGSRACTCQK